VCLIYIFSNIVFIFKFYGTFFYARVSFTKDLDVQPLEICKTFFKNLNQNKIRCCHWKSNINLEKSCAGQTDLDLLVHKRDRKRFNIVLSELEFKRRRSTL